ncbi:hypothetical protein GCM10009549_08500 [Streptomyces thermoalcalitolerans]|uniref:DprA winged helix domain-containing protein n=1 Tax=Streptomyces thermoalcalitolerans TaxID=65605 RepID=A0ABN1NEX4_9ACTN
MKRAYREALQRHPLTRDRLRTALGVPQEEVDHAIDQLLSIEALHRIEGETPRGTVLPLAWVGPRPGSSWLVPSVSPAHQGTSRDHKLKPFSGAVFLSARRLPDDLRDGLRRHRVDCLFRGHAHPPSPGLDRVRRDAPAPGLPRPRRRGTGR